MTQALAALDRGEKPALTAAMNALWAAAAARGEHDYRQFFTDLRTAFPQLTP